MLKKTLIAGAALALIAGAAVARAEEIERVPPIADEVVKKECGACHMAFQPAFLPAASWQKMMAGLDNHFGENASLDEATAKRITDYLVANAGRDMKGEAPLRISELPWFKREHGKEVSPAMLKKAKSFANCTACHKTADQGLYEDEEGEGGERGERGEHEGREGHRGGYDRD
jgi:hypothetical protein